MKFSFLLSTVAALAVSVSAFAANSLTGTYNGSLRLTADSQYFGTEKTTVVLADNGDGTVDLTLKGFTISMVGSTIGDILVKTVAVTEKDGAYTLSKSDYNLKGVPFDYSTMGMVINLKGTLNSEGLNVTFDVDTDDYMTVKAVFSPSAE